MLAANAVASVGLGLYTTGVVLYFTRFVGFGASEVGLGLSLAGLSWLPLAIYAGRLVDRLGARRTAVAGLTVQAALLALGIAVHAYPLFLLFVIALGCCDQLTSVSRNALLASRIVGDQRVRLLAQLRSSFNIGSTIGVGLCGVALGLASPTGYRLILLVNAATCVVTALVLLRVPPDALTEEEVTEPTRRRPAVRDWPYCRLALLAGLVTIADTALTVGIPLWVITFTHAPRAFGAWVIALNTLLVVLLQVRLSRGASGIRNAERMLRRSSLAVAVSFIVLSTTSVTGPIPTIVLIAIAVTVFTIGELWSSAGLWRLRFDLAPQTAQGEYSAIFSLSTTVRTVAGPLLITFFVGDFGAAGWVSLAVLFTFAAAVTGPVVHALVRERDRTLRPDQQPTTG